MSGSNRRQNDPKPAVKEKEPAKPRFISVTELFEGKAGAMVPVPEGKKKKSSRQKPESVVVPAESKVVKPEVTSPSVLKKRDREQKRAEQEEREGERSGVPPLFYVLAPIVIVVLWFGLQAEFSGDASSPDPAVASQETTGSLADRVEYYRKTVGRKLNMQRIGVEYENEVSAPRLKRSAKKVAEPDMMVGVPLLAEQHHRTSSRDRSEPANPDYADMRVQYGLREQEQLADYERRSRQAYVDQFVANAAKAGYRVKVDKNGNVTVLGRTPTDQGGSSSLNSKGAAGDRGPSSAGSMQ